MQTLRTPEDRFADLPDFGYEPHYADVPDGEGGTLRMAWVEDGPATGDPVLLLHGEPSWSFLYRRMLPILAAAGYRAIAPDLVGFGRSDKPAEVADHSYARHVEWVRALAFDVLDLRGVTLVCQDWGGLIGLRLAAECGAPTSGPGASASTAAECGAPTSGPGASASTAAECGAPTSGPGASASTAAEHPDRFARIVAANTGLPTGDHPMPDIWHAFREAVRSAPTLDVARFVESGCRRPMSEQVRAAYDAPFPDESYKAGPRAMPDLVPTAPDDPATEANRAAWAVLAQSPTPVLVAFSDGDPITGAMAPILKGALPGAAGREHPVIAGAGHFLQEDAGEELARHVVEFMRATK